MIQAGRHRRFEEKKDQDQTALQETRLPHSTDQGRLFENLWREDAEEDCLKLAHPGGVLCEQ